jgi:hypothetical protein
LDNVDCRYCLKAAIPIEQIFEIQPNFNDLGHSAALPLSFTRVSGERGG